MSNEAILLFVLVGIVAVLWWALHGLAQWRCAVVFAYIERKVGKGRGLTGADVAKLVDAVTDALPLREHEAVHLLRRARTASAARVCLMLIVAEQGATTGKGGRLLKRASELLSLAVPSLVADIDPDFAEEP